MHQNCNFKIHGSIDLFGSGQRKNGIKFENSWVNRFVSTREARNMHQNFNFKIHGSIDLSRRGKHVKCIKIEISKFMGQSICLAEASTKNASKLKIQNSWVNRSVSPNYAWEMLKIEISKFMGQSICPAEGSTENATN